MSRRRILSAVLGAVLVSACGGAAEPRTTASVSPVQALAEGNAAFAFDLYAQLRDADGNLFICPHSLSTALAMTYAGARGRTAEQMAKTLHFTPFVAKVHDIFAGLEARLRAVQEKGDVVLSTANSLWPQAGGKILSAYLDLVKAHYGVLITPVDYTANAERCRKQINTWVEKETREKIKDLIPAGFLTPLTRLVLTNAVYFKGDWKIAFDKAKTRTEPFRLTSGKSVRVPLMHAKEDFLYAEHPDLQILELPYTGDDLSMCILLPREVDGLKALEKKLSAQRLAEWLPRMYEREVKVALPRFKLTSFFKLNEPLIDMGMTDAFSVNHADFSGMDPTPPGLFIGHVLHKTFVEVNEKGTEAAGASAVIMKLRGMPRPPPEFRADRPFIFLIREKTSGAILFLGRVVDPRAAQDGR